MNSDKHPWPPHYFKLIDDYFLPNGLSRSPWSREAVAGGPISALVACGAEDESLDDRFEIARFTLNILGKVPHAPLHMNNRIIHDGRQTKLHRVTLTSNGTSVAEATVLRVRRSEAPIFEIECNYPEPAAVEDNAVTGRFTMAGAIGCRVVLGDPSTPGRAAAWLSMDGEIIAGRKPSNFVKAALFADFGNGFGRATDRQAWSFANLDINLQFLRQPVSDWFLIDAETHMAGNGHGTASSIFADEKGIYARGTQTIFVSPAQN
jgi:hypothetical protein